MRLTSEFTAIMQDGTMAPKHVAS